MNTPSHPLFPHHFPPDPPAPTSRPSLVFYALGSQLSSRIHPNAYPLFPFPFCSPPRMSSHIPFTQTSLRAHTKYGPRQQFYNFMPWPHFLYPKIYYYIYIFLLFATVIIQYSISSSLPASHTPNNTSVPLPLTVGTDQAFPGHWHGGRPFVCTFSLSNFQLMCQHMAPAHHCHNA